MGNATTAGDLLDRAYYRADMSEGFIERDQARRDLGDAIAELHQLLINSFEDYDIHQNEITLVASTESYDLPSDFLRLRKAFKKTGSDRIEVRKFSLDELGDDSITFTSTGNLFRYRLLGDKIWISPTPGASGTLELWYSKHPVRPTDDQEIVNFSAPSGWEDFLVYDVASKMLMREESDPTAMVTEKEKARQRITVQVGQRDDDADVIVDYYKRFDDYDIERRSGRW